MLYGYLMACNAADIPFLSFPRDEIIEVCAVSLGILFEMSNWPQIIPASYNNSAKRIKIPDLPPEIIPASPEGPRAAAPPSGFQTPQPGLGSGMVSPRGKAGTPEGSNTPIHNGVKTPPTEHSEHDISIRIHDVV